MPGKRPPGEIYLPLAVNFARDPKVRALAKYGAPDAILARDLYVQMCCHCKAELTDGFVPEYELGILVYPLDVEHGKQLAKQLASEGLINEVAGGWQVVAYVRRNGTRDEVEALSQVRAESGRTGGSTPKAPRKTPRQTRREANEKQLASGVLSNAQAITPPETETETETKTDTQTLFGGASAAPQTRTTKRASRIPDDFEATPEMVAWARQNCPQVDGKRETEKFIYYWQGKSGKDATKVDWLATWKRWMLTAAERGSSPTTPATSGQSSGPGRAQQWVEAGRRVQDLMDQGLIS